MDTNPAPQPAPEAPFEQGTELGTEPVNRIAMTRRQYYREDGWTAAVQEDFIIALIEHGSARRAATIADRPITSAYRLRKRNPGFASVCDAARRMAYARLRDEAMDRALNGTLHEVWHLGERTGTRTVHNDRLLIALLNHLKYEPSPRAMAPPCIDSMEERRSAAGRVLALLADPLPSPPPRPSPARPSMRPPARQRRAHGRHPADTAPAAMTDDGQRQG